MPPLITIFGIPDRLCDTDELEKFISSALPNAVAGVPELAITPDDVLSYAPRDCLRFGLGVYLAATIVAITGNVEQAEAALVVVVMNALKEFAAQSLPECRRIEVSVGNFVLTAIVPP